MNTFVTLNLLKHSQKHFLNVLLLMLLIFQGSVSAKQGPKDWQSPFFQDHILVGKVWDTYKKYVA